MKVITLRIPGPFSTGPQYDEDGNLIPSSWPNGLQDEGINTWRKLGKANGGLDLCEFIADDNYPIGDIPGGWRATGGHIWNGVDQSYTDEEDVFHYGLTTEVPTNQSDYTKHIPPPVDENGDPTGDPATYHRIHKYAGWPDIID